MRVLVIGGTGYIGRAVVRSLRAAGHTPVVMARDAASALESIETRVGDLTELDSVRAVITPDLDAVVHAAAPTDDWDAEVAAVRALARALTGRTLIYVSGVWVLGATPDGADETAPTRPIEIVSGRTRVEESVLGRAEVRGIVIRPGIVHGEGGGIPGTMVAWAREGGAGRYVGDAAVRWPMVHLDDVAELVVIALERAQHGSVLHGVAEPAVPVKELAVAADLAAGGSGQADAWPEHEAAAVLGGPFAAALALDQEVTAGAARSLGWTPSRPGALDDMLPNVD